MFVKRLINWVAAWGGPFGTASGQQIPLPTSPVIDQTRPVEADAALQISTVYACIELLANTISSLPICVYKALPGGGREQNRSSPLWFLLHDRPNAWMTPAEFISSMCLNRLLKGNAYAQVVRDSSGDPIALIPLAAGQMEVSVVGGGTVYIYYQDGQITALAPENVIHWKGLGNGYMGLSKLEFMRASLNENIHAQENSSTLFGKGSKPSGVLQTDAKLNEEQMETLRKRFGVQLASPAGGLLIADRGLKYAQLSLNPADAQLLETRRFGVEEICRWFGVPGVLVGTSGQTSWGSGIEQIVDGFNKFTVNPLLTQFEQALHRRLVSVTDSDTEIEFMTDAFLRGSSKDRAAFYQTMVQNGLMTRNEARERENLPPQDGGEMLTTMSNYVPVDQLGKAPDVTTGANRNGI